MKRFLWLMVLLAGTGLAGFAFAEEALEAETEAMETEVSEDEAAAAPAPVAEPYNDKFAIGACIGKGAGLAGIYTYFRPTDHLAFEADLGSRMFIYQNSAGELIDVYWPYMAALKAQFYFLGKQKKIQPGIEVGAMYAEDAGAGGEVSGIMTLRLTRLLHLDANFGFAYFNDMDKNQIDYMVRQRGRARSDYRIENSTGGFALMWGVGMSFVF